MPTCPAGHDSTSADFCDVCGLVIGATASPAPPVVTAPELPAETGPECGDPRPGRFCEGCSYDFVAGARRTPVAAAPAAAPVAAPPAPAVSVAGGWSVVVAADRGYFDAVRQQDGPDVPTISFPAYCPDRNFVLSGKEIRIG